MEIETHKIKKQKGRVEIFKRNNNPNESFSLVLQIIRILSFVLFILLGGFFSYQKAEMSIWIIFLVLLILFVFWLLFEELSELTIWIKRSFKPIMIIEKTKVFIIDEHGRFFPLEIQDIRGVNGKFFTEIKGRQEHRKRIYFVEIFLNLKNGNYLSIDIINSSKLFNPLSHEVIKEISMKSKKIGSLIAQELKVQFFLEKKMNTNTAANNKGSKPPRT